MPCVKSYGAYSLPLGVASHHHRELLSSESHVMPRQDRHQPDLQQDTERSLRFSIVNILKSDFGRDAIRNTKVPNETAVSAANPAQHPRRSPLPLPRDLSVSSTRLSSPQSTSEGHWISYPIREKDLSPLCGIASPLQKHSNGLSRSGSLESLASNRSSATNSSVTSPPSLSSTISGDSLNGENTSGSTSTSQQNSTNNNQSLWPAWVYCTRYSDRPSSGPRTRRMKRPQSSKNSSPEEKRPRTAFSAEQLSRLKREFTENRYLMERRRQELSRELNLNEAQIKIWFQNKRAKLKKASGQKNPLAIQLMAQGLYNHSTVPIDDDDEEIVNERNH